MKLVHPPKLFAVSVILIALVLFRVDSTDNSTIQQIDETVTFSRGHAAIAKLIETAYPTPIRADLQPTPIPTQVPTRVPPTAIPTATPEPALLRSQRFQQYVSQIKDGSAGVIKGIFVDGILELKVVQQPENDWKYVDEQLGTTTQFQSATVNGVIGLLAHNFLSGQLFYQLTPGQEIGVVYGDGKVKVYRVVNSTSYKKIDTSSLTSDLVEQSSGHLFSTQDVFNKYYTGNDHLTLQTCLERDGNWSWGLYFVFAVPE